MQSSEHFGRYKIEGSLGRGGMGDIYRAYDPVLRRWVALKVLRRELVTGDLGTFQRARAHLLREARAAALLNHPNAVAIFDVGEVGETPFLAMELLEGRSLRKYVGDARIELRTRLAWLADIARALGAAHQRGLVHRDMKPENVMVCTDGTIKVLDFGIAKTTRPTPQASGDGPPSLVTMVGNTVGTPRYMAPEIILGQEIDGRADQFAWGVVAYELLTGKHAWAAQEAPTQYGILNEAPPLPPIVLAGLPPDIATIVMRALEKRASDRFPSMQEIVAALDGSFRRSAAAPAVTPGGYPPDPRARPATAEPAWGDKTYVTHAGSEGPVQLRPGEVLDDRYELVSEVGRTSHAVVFRARDLKARTWVALKILARGPGGPGGIPPGGDEKRLHRELLVARSVTHRGVVRMYDLVDVGGRPALTMELVEGETLAASLARGSGYPPGVGRGASVRWSSEQLASFGLEIARALGAVHAALVVHTDLRASKILLRADSVGLSSGSNPGMLGGTPKPPGVPVPGGRPVVTGFGSACVLDGKEDAPPSSLRLSTSAEVAAPALHVAPEIREHLSPVSPAADVYAFGRLWFEAAVGALTELPAKGAAREASSRLASQRPDLDASLVALIIRCLAESPHERFADGTELAAAIEAGNLIAKGPRESQAPSLVDTRRGAVGRSASTRPPSGPSQPGVSQAGGSQTGRPTAASATPAKAKAQGTQGKGVFVGLLLAFVLAVVVGASIVLFWAGAGPAR